MGAAKKYTSGIGKELKDTTLLGALTNLSRAINTFRTYGEQHPVFLATLRDTQSSLNELLLCRKNIFLGAFHGMITIDDKPFDASNGLINSLEKRLELLQITSLRISRGTSDKELKQLIQLLSEQDPAQFKASMGSAGLSHIDAGETTFQAVHKGEHIISGDNPASSGTTTPDLGFSQASAGGGGAMAPSNGIIDLDQEFGEASEPPRSVNVDQIVAFLRGDVDLEDAKDETLSEMMTDPSKLGQLIIDSVAVRQTATSINGESVNDVVLGCLRRTYDGIRKKPNFQNTSAKADLKKSLMLLEESILDRLGKLSGDANPQLDREIVQAIREMDDALSFEIAASRFVKQDKELELSREQMAAYIQANGIQKAEESLKEAGIPEAQWRRIIIESEKVNAGTGAIQGGANSSNSGSAQDSIGALAMVLEELETLMKTEQSSPKAVKTLLGKASESMEAAVSQTHEKLDHLSQQIQTESFVDTGTIGGHSLEMNRKELLSSIAEIAQELMQPLTAINASLEMLLEGFIGDLSPEQSDIVSLARESGDNLKYLMRKLVEIVGIPINKGIDSRFRIPNS